MENPHYFMVSAAFHNTGPIRSLSYHNEYELLFVEDGEIELIIDNKVYVARKNSLTLLANLEQQSLRLRKTESCSRYCIYLHAPITDTYIKNPELLNLLKNHSDLFQHCIDVTPIRDQIITLIKLLIACDGEALYANDLAASYLTELLVHISRLHPDLLMNHLSSSCKKRIYAVQRYLDVHYQEQIRISQVCEMHYISSHYLSHQFKNLTGYSPKQYLTLVRLKHAASMLHDTVMPINEIAWECGFSDYNNFCKQFKNEYNCTPSDFRSQD